MTVKELKNILDRMKDSDLVVMAKDEEGNGFSPLAHITSDAYIQDTSFSGEIGLRTLTKEAIKLGYTEDDVVAEGEGNHCITLWPTN